MNGLHAAFAIPGDMYRTTGGFIYEATVLRELRAMGHRVDHIRLPDSFPDPSPQDVARTLAQLATVPETVPIILDGFIPGTVDPAGLAAIRAPLVAIIHHPLGLETGLAPDRAAFLLRNEAASLAQVDAIVVPSPHTARLLVADFGVRDDKITIAAPGVVRPDPSPLTPADPPLILSVGLLAARKGHDVLLRALAGIEDLRWQAVIAGGTHDPAVADALRAQGEALGPRVRFAGEVTAEEKDRLMRQATIFAFATRFEGYGMVLAEAMTYGLPIVTTRAGAVPDTVGDAAMQVPPDDADAFAKALRILLTDASARASLAESSAARGATLHGWPETAALVADVLSRVRRG